MWRWFRVQLYRWRIREFLRDYDDEKKRITNDTKFKVFLVILLVAYCLLAAKTAFGQKKQPVTIDVMPRFLVCITDRQTIRIRVIIERHVDNRHLSVAWSSYIGESGVSFTQLDGDRSPAVFTIYRQVSCASYLVQACVYRPKATCVTTKVDSTE